MEEQNRNYIFAYTSKLDDELGELRLQNSQSPTIGLVERTVTVGNVAVLNADSLNETEIAKVMGILKLCGEIFEPGSLEKVETISKSLETALINIEKTFREKKLLLDKEADFTKVA